MTRTILRMARAQTELGWDQTRLDQTQSRNENLG